MRTPFSSPRGSQTRGSKESQNLPFPTPPLPSPQRKASNLHREIISHQRFDAVTYLERNTNLDLFWNTLGLNGFRKGQKLSISLIITHKSYKFARLDNFTWKFRCCYIFKRMLIFFTFLGQSRDQMGLKMVKICPSSCN